MEAKERPIVMRAESVRLILEGKKFETRRPVKASRGDSCRYGKKGDRLWVKETFFDFYIGEDQSLPPGAVKGPIAQTWNRITRMFGERPTGVFYRADLAEKPACMVKAGKKWSSPRYMNRELSRITLLLTEDPRLERLGDMTEEECISEGIWSITECEEYVPWWKCPVTANAFRTPQEAYRYWYESINGKGSWDDNEVVRVVRFEVVEASNG